MSEPYRILFVCTGNICRSPTAEGVLRARIDSAGLESHLICDSAGIAGYHIGDPPDRRTVDAARRRGYDLSPLRARKVRASDFRDFDLLLALGSDHLESLCAMMPPDATCEVAMFTAYSAREALRNADVPDPYYGALDGFEHVLDIIEESIEGLMAHVQTRLGGG
jgi:protein-tyrosine phosphatase